MAHEALTQRVKKLAQLAQLELTDEEITLYSGQLTQILGYVDQLQKIDVTGVAPLTHPLELATPLREDVVTESLRDTEGNPKVLASAPEVLQGGYKVPQII